MPEGGASISNSVANTAANPTDGRAAAARGPAAPEPKAAGAAIRATSARRTSLLVTLVLGGLTATPPLAMDMYLPALPEVTRVLHAPAATVQLTLTACMAGMALGQLVVGPMSDRWGRRRPLLAGLAVYILATALCAIAPTVELLIAFRLVQGLAGAAGIVIARAVVRDLYDGVAMARFFSTLMLISGVAPIIAPLIGGQILRITDWRGVFVVLTGVGLLLTALVWAKLPETLAPADRHGGESARRSPRCACCSPTAPSPATRSPAASPSRPSSPTSRPPRSSSRRSTAPRRRRSACCSGSTPSAS
ncbi:hypothetical protein SHKM778_73940 [Streptomyces sp. KM77-8]|uniref:Major facilitator superfamily (MFS) profile domain-containing protein n=1 Tax=Streptomyces haneummycinicus TaxID=3074435 RepID=A0AAT9HU09_9ACTN